MISMQDIEHEVLAEMELIRGQHGLSAMAFDSELPDGAPDVVDGAALERLNRLKKKLVRLEERFSFGDDVAADAENLANRLGDLILSESDSDFTAEFINLSDRVENLQYLAEQAN